MSSPLRTWLATWVALALAPTALAHGPAPSPLGVLAMDETGARAALVRTSIGLAVDHPPDAWTYACPSQWGDHELARATSDGQTVVMVGGGDLYGSTDGACHFEAIAGVEGWYALDAIAWAGRFWAPATLGAGGDDGGLLVVEAGGSATLAHRWEGEDAFRCDAISASASGLVAVGASPAPTLWRSNGDHDALAWSSEPLADLPTDTSHIDLRAVSDEGEIWLVVATEPGRELWRSAAEGWERVGDPVVSIHGPVQISGRWTVVRDGVLETETEDGTWTVVGEVDWTCLDQVDGVVVACTLTNALAIDAIDDGGVTARVVFEMVKLQAPLEGCPSDVDGAASCQSDWVHFGAEAGLLDPNQLSTPGPSSAARPSSAGCGARPPGPSAWAVWLALLMLLQASSRQRPPREDRAP